MDTAAAQARLAAVVRRLAAEKRADLDRHKENHADIARPDFLWHYLLQSFRMIVHPTIGGRALRIRLSNAFGRTAVTFRSLSVARRVSGRKGNRSPQSGKLRQRQVGEHDPPPRHVHAEPRMHQHEREGCGERQR